MPNCPFCVIGPAPLRYTYPHGRLAQRLAQVLYTHKAGGSNPSSPTIELLTVPPWHRFLFEPVSEGFEPEGREAEQMR